MHVHDTASIVDRVPGSSVGSPPGSPPDPVRGEVHVGLDVHAATVSVAVAGPGGGEAAFVGQFDHRPPAVRKLVSQLARRYPHTELVFWQEAGPCGFELHRVLEGLGCQSVVIAPSHTDLQPGRRIKTDRRDAEALARAGRAGMLTPVWVPEPRQEAIRSLCRCRHDAKRAQRAARQQLSAFLLRHGRHFSTDVGSGKPWTQKHRDWLQKQAFEQPADRVVFDDCLAAVDAAGCRIAGLDRALTEQVDGWELEPLVKAYMAMRGIDRLLATVLAAELGDLSRFARPRQLMAYLGLVPSEHSSGSKRRVGAITKTGNAYARRMLVEAAWSYRFPARVTPAIKRRVAAAPPTVGFIAWTAQKRLCGRYRHLTGPLNKRTQAACVGIAREMCGFLWAIAEEVRALADREGGLREGEASVSR